VLVENGTGSQDLAIRERNLEDLIKDQKRKEKALVSREKDLASKTQTLKDKEKDLIDMEKSVEERAEVLQELNAEIEGNGVDAEIKSLSVDLIIGSENAVDLRTALLKVPDKFSPEMASSDPKVRKIIADKISEVFLAARECMCGAFCRWMVGELGIPVKIGTNVSDVTGNMVHAAVDGLTHRTAARVLGTLVKGIVGVRNAINKKVKDYGNFIVKRENLVEEGLEQVRGGQEQIRVEGEEIRGEGEEVRGEGEGGDAAVQNADNNDVNDE
jgi:hypothetical protein